MKPFLQFIREDLSPETYDTLAPYDSFPPNNRVEQENDLYQNVEFTDFSHYMKTQIAVVSRYIASQGIGDDPKKLKAALNDAFMKPEIQKAFRLYYARNFPDKVAEV